MFKKMMAVGLAALAALAILVGVVAYSYLKPAAAASGPIQAIAIASTDPSTDSGTAAARTVYTIDQAASEARFVIDEVLNGSPFTVVGTTDQVAGEIALSLTDPSAGGAGDPTSFVVGGILAIPTLDVLGLAALAGGLAIAARRRLRRR